MTHVCCILLELLFLSVTISDRYTSHLIFLHVLRLFDKKRTRQLYYAALFFEVDRTLRRCMMYMANKAYRYERARGAVQDG